MAPTGRSSTPTITALFATSTNLQRFNNTDKECDVDYILLKNDNDDISAISKCVSELKKENASVLVQNEIPENIKYRKAFKMTAKGVEEI